MTTREILSAFPKLSALVVGDICLDRWCTYDPCASEPSRETGIPRIGIVRSVVTPGAAGTVANNLAALGIGRVAVIGVVGDDGSGYELTKELRQGGVNTDMLVTAPRLPTFTYTKVINLETGIEDHPRLDFICTDPLLQDIERQLLDTVVSAVPSFDVVLISDHAETRHAGVVTPALRTLLAELALRYPDKVLWGDSRTHLELFRNLIMKPNHLEAENACVRLFGEVNYQRLRRHVQSHLLFVTQGSVLRHMSPDLGDPTGEEPGRDSSLGIPEEGFRSR